MKAGVLAALKPLLSSMVPELRLHAVWALKNLAQECDSDVQGLLLCELTWQGFRELLVADDDVRVREQATGLLQNFLCKGGESVSQVGDADSCGCCGHLLLQCCIFSVVTTEGCLVCRLSNWHAGSVYQRDLRGMGVHLMTAQLNRHLPPTSG